MWWICVEQEEHKDGSDFVKVAAITSASGMIWSFGRKREEQDESVQFVSISCFPVIALLIYAAIKEYITNH